MDKSLFLANLQRLVESSKSQDELDAALRELAKLLPTEFVEDLDKDRLAQAAQADTPEGFYAHYELITGTKPPPHVVRQTRKVYTAHENGRGFVLRATRGFWKTTTWGVVFLTFRIAHDPIRTNVVISANDDSAEKITKAITAIIEFHPDWKRAYPTIMPDKERGWSVEGYYIKDTGVSSEEWAKLRSTVIDPTLVGGGIESTRINGKHPSGVLYCDDVHDLNNSRSEKERRGVVERMTGVVLKTAIRENDKLVTWVFGVGVPWADDDAYQKMVDSGQYDYEVLPAMRKAEEGDEGAIFIDGRNPVNGAFYSDIMGWWKLEWGEKFGISSIIAERSLGKAEFWQMIMMDITTGRTGGFKYYSFPHERIDPTWLHSGGCDFATLKDSKKDAGRDLFSIAYGAKTPYNTMVIVDGVIEQCTQAQAEDYLKNSHLKFKHWRTGIFEGDGAGEQFYLYFIQRNRGARWGIKKTGGKAKRYRQESEMSPWLENGTVLISDADTPYLNALRKALDEFPDGNNDVRDGLYWLCHAFPEVLVMPTPPQNNLPVFGQAKRTTLKSAWSST